MSRSRGLGRLALLAGALGIGAALAATPGVALADPVSAPDPNVAAALDAATGIAGAAADPAGSPDPDVAISIDGFTLFAEGTANATSGTGDLAIALGPNSIASAGLFGIGSTGDFAFADGTGTVATDFGGSLDFATAVGNASTAVANGNLDSATVFGPNSLAEAHFGNGDLASVVNTGSAPDEAVAGGSIDNSVLSVLGNLDVASVLGTDSTAEAGANATAPGSFDLAAVSGDMLTATATGSNFLADIVPSL
jgi:hypothetical protein